jgi:hypothetical protein
MPEHLECVGPTGSGKSFLLVDILKERVRRRHSATIFVATKAADATVAELGWPIVDTWQGVRRHDQCIFWPRTSRIGQERKAYQAAKIENLLGHLWQPKANTVVDFDEEGYIETLSPELRAILLMYLREGRSHGITCVLSKQRIQGAMRDMHSETDWKIAFRMNDREDNERSAELFGSKRAYLPVLEGLNREKHEFLIQHKLTDTQYVSWVDKPLAPHTTQQTPGYLARG